MIADKIGRSKSTIHSVIRKFKKYKKVSNIKQLGAKPKLNDRLIKKIKRRIKLNPAITLREIIDKLILNIHYTTLSRTLKKNGIRNYKVIVKPKISAINKSKRLGFALKYEKKNTNYWNQFAFADSCSFALHAYRKERCWRPRGKVFYRERNKDFVLKYSKFWGYITPNGIGELVKVENRFNSQSFCTMLANSFIKNNHNTSYKLIQELILFITPHIPETFLFKE